MCHLSCLIFCLLTFQALDLSFVKGQRSVTLTPTNPSQGGATFVNMGATGEVTTTESNQWNISAADLFSFHLGLHLSSDWAFHPTYSNTVTFTINSPTMIDDSFNDVLFAFQVSGQYVALRVTTDETYISPRYSYVGHDYDVCPVETYDWFQPIAGNVVAELEREAPTSDLSRAEVLELPAVLSGYCRMSNISGTQHLEMPLKFELTTWPGAAVRIRYEAGGSQSAQGLKTFCDYRPFSAYDSGLDIYMAVTQPGQNFVIDSIELSTDYPMNPTVNPTANPTSTIPASSPEFIPTGTPLAPPAFPSELSTSTPYASSTPTSLPTSDGEQGEINEQQNTSVWAATTPVWAVIVVVLVVMCGCIGCIGCIVALVCCILLRKEKESAIAIATDIDHDQRQQQPPQGHSQPQQPSYVLSDQKERAYAQQQQQLSEPPPQLREQPGSVVSVASDDDDKQMEDADANGTGALQMMPRPGNIMHQRDESQQLEGLARIERAGHRESSKDDDDDGDDDDGSELFKAGRTSGLLETGADESVEQATPHMS